MSWYDAHHRKLPWRENISPYRTWISEIMLQQTQVATVVPYYIRFLKEFPTLRSLAQAPEANVIRSWAGLGYYSRARNLHKAARATLRENGGVFPDSLEKVLELPGIGRYTAGAILSIAFNRPLPVLDGNVMRVFARLFGIETDLQENRMQKLLWSAAEAMVDPLRPGDWNQALMELGATVCQPVSPRCGQCPMARTCAAFHRGVQEEIPRPRKQKKTVRIRWECLWIENGGKILLNRRPDSERLLPGHWGLPERKSLPSAYAGPVLASLRHSITHHQIDLRLIQGSVTEKPPKESFIWAGKPQSRRYLISSIWTKILGRIESGTPEEGN